jgi:hypothetical protein
VCCEGCITEHKQAVPLSVCAVRSVELDQLVKIFIVFYQTPWMTMAILCLIIHQIIFRPLVISAVSLMSISVLYLSIFTSNSAALYALSNISGTYFLCTIRHNNFMHWNVGNSTTKCTNVSKCYTTDLIY